MKISQREARRLRKRVDELERVIVLQRMVYGQEWPGGVEIDTHDMHPSTAAAITVARRLGHAVVVINGAGNVVRFIALPHPKVDGL